MDTGAVWLIFLVLSLSVCRCEAAVVVANTGVGQIAGQTQDVTLPDGTQSTIAAFLGIPYAEPPVGQLRFAKPVPKASFTRRFPALAFPPACPHINRLGGSMAMSEDCLYLNVFTLATALSKNAQNRLPVLVWIHGGAFQSGQAARRVETPVVFGNITVVTINYRLGALGFLTTGDQHAPGNYGLWDQRLALQWVKNNIAAFGGDPNKITIGGSSAGAQSVTFQAMYPGNKGLFQRILVASGTSISAASARGDDSIYAKILAVRLGCPATAAVEIVSCLREQSFADIVGTQVKSERPFEHPFYPGIDGDFIIQNPADQVTWPPSQADLSTLKSLDAMFGTASAEGSISFAMWVSRWAQQRNESVQDGVSPGLFRQVIDNLLLSENQTLDPLVQDAIVYEYTDWEDPTNPARLGQSTVDLLTDKQWFVPNVVFSRNHAVNNANRNTYVFLYDQSQQYGAFGFPWLKGAPHVSYESFAFGNSGPEIPIDLSFEADRASWEVSKLIMTYWSNFIKTGNPNRPLPVKENWPLYKVQDEQCLSIQDDVTSALKRCKAMRTDFWLHKLPKVKAASRAFADDAKRKRASSGASNAEDFVNTLTIVGGSLKISPGH